MKLHPVFKPVESKGHRITSINLFRNAIVVSFEADLRIKGLPWTGEKLRYVKIAHPSAVPNLSVSWRTTVTRILFHDGAALVAPLMSGRKVHIEPYTSNNSQNLDQAGLNCESLVINVEGLGYYTLDQITDMTSGRFGIYGSGSKSRCNKTGEEPDSTWEEILNNYRKDTSWSRLADVYGPRVEEKAAV